nr:unnamed protein product [Spirometra erinaceieuropaei]
MTDAVSALERGATAADVGPSRLHLPLCTAEAYEDFVRRLTTVVELADKAVCVYLFDCSQIRQLAMVGGRSVKDFVRNLLTALIGPPLCNTFCWRGGSKEKRSFLACPLFSIVNDAIDQNPRFSNCNREVLRLTAINWFHGSKDRYGGRSRRRRNIHTFQGVPTDDLACPQLSPPKHTNCP